MSEPADTPRDRLLDGMAQAIRERGGFQGVTVADVVAHARTSRRTFYEHFRDREDCFLALFDRISDQLLAATAQASAEGSWAERVDAGVAVFLDVVAAEPAVARACLLEMAGLGERGAERVRAMSERWARQTARLVNDEAADEPGLRPLSPELAHIVTAGFRDLVVATLDRGGDPARLRAAGAEAILRLVVREPLPTLS